MNHFGRSLTALTVAILLALPGLQQAAADNFDAKQRAEIERIIRDYLLQKPEVLEEAYTILQKRQAEAEAREKRAAIADNAQAMFDSPRQVTLGNREGDVTLVEFFDYNCGYCKRALSDMLALLENDPRLKVVLKEYPVLGPESVEAARVAVAVHMQDPSGEKYLAFHQKLLGSRGRADRAHALAAAKAVGMDMARLARDLESPEVQATLEENFALADAVGINGTPSYVVGSELVIGAVGLKQLASQVNVARCGKAVC